MVIVPTLSGAFVPWFVGYRIAALEDLVPRGEPRNTIVLVAQRSHSISEESAEVMTINAVQTRTTEVNGCAFAYRETGPEGGVPVVFLHHLTAVLDDWDPAVVDAIAAERRVVLLDNRGVGRSEGETPDTIEAMADDVIAFLEAAGIGQADLLGLSMGGMVAQVVAHRRPELVRRLVLAGTTPAGDPGPSNGPALLHDAFAWAAKEGRHPKHYLFFRQTPDSQAAGDAFLARLDERTEDRDVPASEATIGAQLTALAKWELESKPVAVPHPTLVVNGDDDVMVPTLSSFTLATLMPNAQLSIYPNSGHAAVFQYPELFSAQVLTFLS